VDEIGSAVAAWQVEEAMNRLTPDHRRVVVDVYYRGRTSAQAAERLGIPEGTVRSRLFYALRALKVALDELGWER
jgi:RNA polymerase sigma-70 factor (ECF subfamily)